MDRMFFDSYALIEIFNGNMAYEKYKKIKVITTYFQIYEVYYNLRKIYSDEEIIDFFNYLKSLCVDLDFDWIAKASDFRFRNKKQDLSYADCLGYVAAKSLGVKFLTGDKEFKGIDGVEWVK